MRLDSNGNGESWPCWVDFADVSKLGELPLAGQVSLAGQPPGALGAASYGKGLRFVDGTGGNTISGTTDLALSLGLVGGSKLIAASGIDPNGDATVPATFTLQGGAVNQMSVELDEMPAAINAATEDADPAVAVLAASPGSVVVSFVDVADDVTVIAPFPSEVLRFTDADDFAPAMEACGS